ncbi:MULTISPECIES: sugar ABC transporter substrate-binding protein [unclassified Micromonospora]|uniref:sugar ABC transporter substrate-binding protein n=1 Tax=unclassified Micromonospora TaxID=2617518 RepID=UPI003A890A4C
MKRKSRFFIGVAVAALTVSASAGCGSDDATVDSGGQEGYRIGFVNGNTIQFHTCLEKSVRAQAEAKGVELLVANSAGDPAKEISNVEDMIIKQVDAIIVQTVNIDAQQGDVDRANRADVPIFLTSVAAVDPNKILGAATTDVEHAGALLGQWVAEDGGQEPAEIAIIGGAPGASADLMNKGFKAALGDGQQVVFEQPALWQRAKAQEVAENLLQGNPGIKYLFVHNEDMAFGALSALRAANRDDIKIVTINGTDDGLAAIRDGQISATISQPPRLIGEMAIDAVVSLLDAENGGSGPAAPKVQQIPDQLITKSNVDQAPQYCL